MHDQSPDWELPRLKAFMRLWDKRSPRQKGIVFGVQFYPYVAPGVDPFFAVVGDCETVVCRLTRQGNKPVEFIRAFKDEDVEASLNSCAWTTDPTTGHPLICVAGALPKINVLNVVTGQLVKTLIGHGSGINDLAVSPVSSDILASGSEDRTIRVWSLQDRHQAQPCALICAGEGHKESILTIAFHASGRYLLSGGMDCIVNLWALPDLLNEELGREKPVLLYYPHFSTSAIHSDYVDCVMFFHDLILSKCAREGKIVLWRISGFDSGLAPPSMDEAPINLGRDETQSAFGSGYERLLQFRTGNVDPFYMRFGLFHQPNKHAVLAMGNLDSTIHFWDIQQLVDPFATSQGSSEAVKRKRRRSSAERDNTPSTNVSTSTTSGRIDRQVALRLDKRKKTHDISDPFKEVPAHKSVLLKRKAFVTRQIAWSVGGEWMVATGDQGMIAIFSRWETEESYVQHGAQS